MFSEKPRLCINCKHYRPRPNRKRGQLAGYCLAYEVPDERFNGLRDVIVQGRIYGSVAKTGSCGAFEHNDK